MKGGANDLALAFRIADARQAPQKQICPASSMHERIVVVIGEERNNFVGLDSPDRIDQPGIDENAGELVADHQPSGSVLAATEESTPPRKTADYLPDCTIWARIFCASPARAKGMRLFHSVGFMPAMLRYRNCAADSGRAARRMSDFGMNRGRYRNAAPRRR